MFIIYVKVKFTTTIAQPLGTEKSKSGRKDTRHEVFTRRWIVVS